MIQEMNLQKMKSLMKMKDDELLEYLYTELKKNYSKIIYNPKYIIAAGEGSICLLAHVDTVFKTPPTFFFHDQEQHILWSPEGMGADDRAGIYAILAIIEEGYRPHIIFTTGEEIGGVGARQLIQDFPNIKTIMKDLKFLIQLDRRGSKDSVYYDCDNAIFEQWINGYDFETADGSYTDISIVAPVWEVAAVNLSIGYYYEHTDTEILVYPATIATINKVMKMLDDCAGGKGPESTIYIPRMYKGTTCPVCCRNKLTKDSPNVSRYGLGINLICQSCYDEYFKD